MCAWGWVPNHCGTPNMYMAPYKCNVTGATSTTPVAPPKPGVWCEGNSSACTPGSKQMIYFNQLEGNNWENPDSLYQEDGQLRSPGYNQKLGFADGAQNDIFESGPSSPPTTTRSTTTTTSSSLSTTTSSSVAAVPTHSNHPSHAVWSKHPHSTASCNRRSRRAAAKRHLPETQRKRALAVGHHDSN